MPIRSFVRAALLAALVLGAFPAAAQPEPEPARPSLPRGADPNDWEAYFEEGERRFTERANRSVAAFYWASRLDPTRAEPLFARLAAFFGRDQGSWTAYLNDDPRVLRRPEVIRNDSLLSRAFDRNPFVHRGLEVALYTMLGRRLRRDAATPAFIDYAEGDFQRAADLFGRVVRSNPERNVRLRHWRALSLLGAGDLDGAAAEIEELLSELRRNEEERVAPYYESKSMYEHALGMLEEARGRPAAARRAFEQALVEDFASVPARAALARMALRERRAAEAVRHLAEAVEIAPHDGVMHFEHAVALAAAGRGEEAREALRRAIDLEPHWAAPYLQLGTMLDGAGDVAGAAAAYRMYLDRAPRSQLADITRVRARLAALGG
jgi:tetratricopeptide (TPR) repeat protein